MYLFFLPKFLTRLNSKKKKKKTKNLYKIPHFKTTIIAVDNPKKINPVTTIIRSNYFNNFLLTNFN